MAAITLLNTLESIQQTVLKVAAILQQQQRFLATAESCTGGGIAYFLTNSAGSSQWFDRAYITYSNQAKQDMLSVSTESLQRFGAVSEAVVNEMALAALGVSASVSVAVSGIAGPTGGSAEKPVGTVCFAWACRDLTDQKNIITHLDTQHFEGDRQMVRLHSVLHALKGILKVVDLD